MRGITKLKIKGTITNLMVVLSLTACTGGGGSAQSTASDSAESLAGTDYKVSGFNEGSNSYSYDSAEYDYDYDDTSENVSDSTNDLNTMVLSDEKLVYRCNLGVETTEYLETKKYVKQKIYEYDGIIQSESEYNNSYNWYYSDYIKDSGTLSIDIEARIPSAHYKEFVEELESNLNNEEVVMIKSKEQSVDNISQEYYDTKNVLETLEVERERLMDMLKQSEDIETMLQIEQRLSEVEQQINTLTTEVTYMDLDVAYSYITLNIDEVLEITEDYEQRKTNKFLDRLKNTLSDTGVVFLNFLEELLFLIIRMSPFLVLLGILIAVYVKLIHKKVKHWWVRHREKENQKAYESMIKKNQQFMMNRNNNNINNMMTNYNNPNIMNNSEYNNQNYNGQDENNEVTEETNVEDDNNASGTTNDENDNNNNKNDNDIEVIDKE